MDVKAVLAELTLEEKISLLSGTNFMYTNGVERLGVPSLCMSDGPHGLRKQSDDQKDNGISLSLPATAFPTAATIACSWNPRNLYVMAQAIADECANYDVDVLLGPGINIKKNPLCGRNFEYFSEDPLLSGKMGAAEVNGLQSKGIVSCLKHFALNSEENFRFLGNSICDKKAMLEIYLKSFEIAVKESSPKALMCAYNKVNGTWCSENKKLLTDKLRNEWGFTGATMSDWGATHDRVNGVKAGLDLEMPGDTYITRKWISEAVENGVLSMQELDSAVEHVLDLVDWVQSNKDKRTVKPGSLTKSDFEAHSQLASLLAQASAVLLKNDGILPLNKEEKILVCGDFFGEMRYQGAGSSMINPTEVVTPKDGFDAYGASYIWYHGDPNVVAENPGKKKRRSKALSNTDESMLPLMNPDEVGLEEKKHSVFDTAVFSKINKVVVFAGLTDEAESEGLDRETMKLPVDQLELIDSLCDAGKQIVVVLFGGSPVELPFKDKVAAILNMYLPGQCGGKACTNLLYGEANPGGKLAETWCLNYSDVPFGSQYSKTKNEIFRESNLVGYRYYCSANKEVLFPFGYGLSYTSFEYSNFKVKLQEKIISIDVDVQNVGDRDGSDVVQVYVRLPKEKCLSFCVDKELVAFEKVNLAKGSTKHVHIEVEESVLERFNLDTDSFKVLGGVYEFFLCQDAATILKKANLFVMGDITLFNRKSFASAMESRSSISSLNKALGVKNSSLDESLDRSLAVTSAPDADQVRNQIQFTENFSTMKDSSLMECHKEYLLELIENPYVPNDPLLEKILGHTIPLEEPVLPLTMDSRFSDFNETRMGRILYKAVMMLPESQMKKAKKMPYGSERKNMEKGGLFLKRILDSNSLIGMTMSAGSQMPYNIAEGLLEIANGKVFRGLMKFIRK